MTDSTPSPSTIPVNGEDSIAVQEESNGSFKHKATQSIKHGIDHVKQETFSWSKEIHDECFGCMRTFEVFEVFEIFRDNWRRFVYNPYLPSLHKPGWMLNYALGPYNAELFGSFMLDFWAGVTVALTLIPQVSTSLCVHLADWLTLSLFATITCIPPSLSIIWIISILTHRCGYLFSYILSIFVDSNSSS